MSNYMNNNDNGYELGWDAEIEKEGTEFIVAENGDYNFTVVGFERARFNGSAKMPACNQAKLSIRLEIPDASGECIIKHNLFLHSKSEWRLCEFFAAIGQRQKGQRVSMNWNAVPGAKGRCKVSKRSYEKEGKTYWTNDIDKFYAPEGDGLPFHTSNLPQQSQQPQYQVPQYPQPSQQPGGYTVGKF